MNHDYTVVREVASLPADRRLGASVILYYRSGVCHDTDSDGCL